MNIDLIETNGERDALPLFVVRKMEIEHISSEKKWTLKVIEQLTDEDIVWSPTPESNSIANLVAHIWGTVHQRIETAFFNVPDTRNRDKEFDRTLQLSIDQALELITKSFDTIIVALEKVKGKPEMLLEWSCQ